MAKYLIYTNKSSFTNRYNDMTEKYILRQKIKYDINEVGKLYMNKVN